MRITLGQLRRLVSEAIDELDSQTVPDPNLSIEPVNDMTYERLSPEEKRSWDISIYSDIYKEKHGIRPRWMYEELTNMSEEEFNKEMARLEDEEGEWDTAHKMWGDEPDPGAPYPESEMFADDPGLSEPDPWEGEPVQEPVRQPSRMKHRRH